MEDKKNNNELDNIVEKNFIILEEKFEKVVKEFEIFLINEKKIENLTELIECKFTEMEKKINNEMEKLEKKIEIIWINMKKIETKKKLEEYFDKRMNEFQEKFTMKMNNLQLRIAITLNIRIAQNK
jgi:hypothetical protein